jgi:hypothetical protein
VHNIIEIVYNIIVSLVALIFMAAIVSFAAACCAVVAMNIFELVFNIWG